MTKMDNVTYRLLFIFIVALVLVLGYVSLYYSEHILFNKSYGRYRRLSSHIEMYPVLIANEINSTNIRNIYFHYKHVATHEFAHYIWDNLNKSFKKHYKEYIFNNSNFVTDYSKVSAEEHFADYFAIYMNDRFWFLNHENITKEEKHIFEKLNKIVG